MKNKHKYMMDKAKLAAAQSYCERNKVGAVLEKAGRSLIDGYNGTLKGTDNICEDKGITKNSVIHAEQNVIAFAARHGIAMKGCSLYLTVSPCVQCAKLIVQAGIKKVIYREPYRQVGGISLLLQNGVKVKQLKEMESDKNR